MVNFLCRQQLCPKRTRKESWLELKTKKKRKLKKKKKTTLLKMHYSFDIFFIFSSFFGMVWCDLFKYSMYFLNVFVTVYLQKHQVKYIQCARVGVSRDPWKGGGKRSTCHTPLQQLHVPLQTFMLLLLSHHVTLPYSGNPVKVNGNRSRVSMYRNARSGAS